jgi:hypothetical protein
MDAKPGTEDLAQHFVDAPSVFETSPLYQALCKETAGNRPILELLRNRRSGQQPSFLLFGAAHDLLMSGVSHALRDYYPSLTGNRARDPADAGPVFREFCGQYADELEQVIRTRLVQSNVVRRAAGLRYALWAIGKRCKQPVHLIEVGASAGLLLNVDRYRYLIGDQAFGRPGAPVTIDSRWRSTEPVPDLDDVPGIASRTGIDLNPVDITDARERRWLMALVWPEERGESALLEAAIGEAVQYPLTIIAGDAIDLCRGIGRDLPAGEPRVVFHAATRMHVPGDQHAAFDTAIDAIGESGPLYHVWLEPPSAPHHPYQGDHRGVIAMHGPGDDEPSSLVRADGHLHWLEPLRRPMS